MGTARQAGAQAEYANRVFEVSFYEKNHSSTPICILVNDERNVRKMYLYNV